MRRGWRVTGGQTGNASAISCVVMHPTHRMLGPSAWKAALMGAKTVKGPGPESVDTRPPAQAKGS